VAVQRLSNSGQSGYGYKSLIAGITPLPSVPTIGIATAVNYASVNVAFTAPGAYAGATYTATSSPGGLTGTSASSPILVTGLSELTAYTFTVTATNATGTSGASAASDAVTTPAGDNGVMFPIQMVSVGAAGSSTISFTSIPSTYKHLQIRAMLLSTDVDLARFNGDTGANYAFHGLRASGSSASAYGNASTSSIQLGTNVPSSAIYPQIYVLDILDYASTSKYKTTRTLFGYDTNNTSSGQIEFTSGLWLNTAAISSITLSNSAGHNQYSSYALYGIKGA
jgi:hypothetical protein